jgi:hypothetical protein
MDRWFRKKGYLQCGFHYCVTRSGITETRDHQTIGAHLAEQDRTSVAIGILGWDGKHPDTLDPLAYSNFLSVTEMLAKEYPHATINAAPEFLETRGGYEPLIELAAEAQRHVRSGG